MSTPLREILSEAGNVERISTPEAETFVTVKLNGAGAVKRQIKSGKTPVPFTGYRLQSGQFIYSRIDARNGAFAIVPPELDGAVVSKDFPPFSINHSRVDTRYLEHFFKGGSLIQAIRASSFGATNRQRVKENAFLSLTITLPALTEQHRITSTLDEADAIRTKRRAQLAHIDELPQALFATIAHENFTYATLSNVASTTSGGTPSRTESGNYGGSTPWVKSGELHSRIVTHTSENLTEQGLKTSSAKIMPIGTVLLAMYGATAGAVSTLGIQAATNQAICCLTPGPKLTTGYLAEFLRASSEELLSQRSGGAQPNLSQKTIRSLRIPLPPLSMQHEFADRLAEIHTERDRVARALEADEELFAALQYRAFRGEI